MNGIKIASTIIGLAFCSVGFAHEAPAGETITINNENSGMLVTIAADSELIVHLPANHSTGYRWVLVDQGASPLVTAEEPGYHTSGSDAGASGLETWTLSPANTGRQMVRFEYRRPWENYSEAEQTAVFDVIVR